MDGVQLYVGWRVALLGLASVQLLTLAVVVSRQDANRTANRVLAAVLVVLTGVITPYSIGFAGAYDAWRWLTFAPFALTLALPPLLFGYTHALVRGRLPDRFGLHLVPVALQLAYFLVCFALPLADKWDWYTGGHARFVRPLFEVALLVSLSVYAALSLRRLSDYRRDLAEARSDDDRFAAVWLSRVIVALVAVLAIYAAFAAWDWISGGIDHFQETGLYLSLAGIGLYLGVEGWRHAALPVPTLTLPNEAEPETKATRAVPDWAAVAVSMEQRTRQAGWWREADLDLPGLARRLGTNTGRVSRAINLGLGMNFSAFVNGLRAEGVADVLEDRPDADLLDVAFDMGFASKASFNRAFRARFGMAPSHYRRQVSNPDFQRNDTKMRRAGS